MKDQKQLLANLLSYIQVPFGEYKDYITSENQLRLSVSGVPFEELARMMESAGYEMPASKAEAEAEIREAYRNLDNVEEQDYSGSYRNSREQDELDNLSRELDGEDEGNSDEEDEEIGSDQDNQGSGNLLEKYLNDMDGEENPQSFDDYLKEKGFYGKGGNKGKKGQGEQGQGEKGQGEKGQGEQGQGEQGQGKQGQGEQGQGEKGQGEQGQGEQGQDEKGQGEQGQGEQGQGEQGQGEQGQGEKGQGEQGQGEQGQGEQGQDEQGQGEKGQGEQGQGEKGQGEQGQGEQGQGEKGQGEQGQGEGEGEGEGEKGQGQGGGKGEINQNSLEQEIKLCIQEIALLTQNNELIALKKKKTKQDNEELEKNQKGIEALSYQIGKMQKAIDSGKELKVSGSDMEKYTLPFYTRQTLEEKKKEIEEERKQLPKDFKWDYQTDDVIRRNGMILERVLPTVTTYIAKTISQNNLLLPLYLTKDDLMPIVLGQNKDGQVVNVTISKSQDSIINITPDTDLQTFYFQMNEFEKNIEKENKQRNINFIFEAIKQKLSNEYSM